MYRRSKFLEVLLEIRQEMAREADYDVDLFAEMVRSGGFGQAATHSVTESSTGREVANGSDMRTRRSLPEE